MHELAGLDSWLASFLPLLLAAFVSGAIVGLERQHVVLLSFVSALERWSEKLMERRRAKTRS